MPLRLNLPSAALAAVLCMTFHPVARAVDSPPPVIKAIESRGVSNLVEFNAGTALRGFAGMAASGPVAVYVTPDGNAIAGTRLNPQGVPMDTQQVAQATAKPMGMAAWKKLESMQWIGDGRSDAPRTVYVISDPNCSWCHRFWEASRPWVEAGKVQLRHILVGLVRNDSEAKAAAIMTASNRLAAIEINEKNFSSGGITPMETVPPETKRILDANLALMKELGFRGTPALIYQERPGDVGFLAGFPRGTQLDSVLGSLK